MIITFGLKWCHTIQRAQSFHYNDVIMSAMASQITSLTIVYSTVYSDADHRKHPSSVSLAFVRGIHRWPVHSPHNCPVTRKMFPFDDVIMYVWKRVPSWLSYYSSKNWCVAHNVAKQISLSCQSGSAAWGSLVPICWLKQMLNRVNSDSLSDRDGWIHTYGIRLTMVTSCMMTSLNGNIFRVTGHLCGEFTGPR